MNPDLEPDLRGEVMPLRARLHRIARSLISIAIASFGLWVMLRR